MSSTLVLSTGSVLTSGSSILISPIVIRQSCHEGNLLMLISEHATARDKDWSCYNE